MSFKAGDIAIVNSTARSYSRFNGGETVIIIREDVKHQDPNQNLWYVNDDILNLLDQLIYEKDLELYSVLPIGINVAITGCQHAWKVYSGLKESFEYCEKCDEKRSCIS